MITNIRSDKMVVISDMHLGNPFSKARERVLPFIHWAANSGYDICINGDGLEIAQASFSKIAVEVPELLRAIGQVSRAGRNVYYIIGNHDILLEHFLEDWGMMKVSPFLNVTSGDKRIRIEHGHIYDPFFIKHPRLYEAATFFGGLVLKIWPNFYRGWISFERFKSRWRARKLGIVGEHPSFQEAANEISKRGFDSVIFGHTHHPGQRQLDNGVMYYNPGSWMRQSQYVVIDSGEVKLTEFTSI
jgi:UDP-2,3-diacylglucosamine pyrophosphatase LpxH